MDNVRWRFPGTASDIDVLFVVGAPRSGITLVQKLAKGHPAFFSILGGALAQPDDGKGRCDVRPDRQGRTDRVGVLAVKLRTDIQALRGIAVLLVLFHHARLTPLEGGFLGVDLFFVISGFLITGLVANGIEKGTFSLAEFYWRRACRLLPAAYVVFLACIVAAPLLLTEAELADFLLQLLGSLTFTANLVLNAQSGYFDTAAEFKPLLHVWSLSIEEQYYLLLPAALLLLPRRTWLGVAVIATLCSLVACQFLMASDPNAAFYLMPTRAWELGLGSILALSIRKVETLSSWASWLSPVCLLVIAVVAARPISDFHPGIDAVLVCFATVGLLAFPSRLLNGGWLGRGLARVGDISYSLYLVHWPIFAYLNGANLSGVGLQWPLRLGAVVASILLAYLLYVKVEQRFRVRDGALVSRAGVAKVLVASGSLAAIAMVASSGFWSGAHGFGDRMRGVDGLAAACIAKGPYEARPECQTSARPKLMVWGDSHAMHLVPGLASFPGIELVQATQSSCAPIVGLATFGQAKFAEGFSASCIQFSQGVLVSAAESEHLDTVVLSSLWSYVLKGQAMLSTDGKLVVRKAGEDLAVRQLVQTIAALRKAGKRVVIVGPPPVGGFDAGRCLQRLTEGKWSFGGTQDCGIDKVVAMERGAEVQAFLARVGKEANVNVFTFWPLLCDADRCNTRWGGTMLYRDGTHFSHEGSVALAKRSNLATTLMALAR